MTSKKFSTTCLIGLANAGKSTFFNALLKEKLVATSSKPQTTVDTTLGLLTDTNKNIQIAIYDTPGFCPKLKKISMEKVNESDFFCYLVSLKQGLKPMDSFYLNPEFLRRPGIVFATQGDLFQKEERQKRFDALKFEIKDFPMIDVCAREKNSLNQVLNRIFELGMTSGQIVDEFPYESEAITNKPLKKIAEDFIREQLFRQLGNEIPYFIDVETTLFDDAKPYRTKYCANLYVHKKSHQGIVIGKNGAKLNEISEASRACLVKLLGKHVDIKLYVKLIKDGTGLAPTI